MGTDQIRHCRIRTISNICINYCLLYYIGNPGTENILSSDCQRQEYLDDYKLQIQKTKEIQGTRGNIYDRNGNLLAYNELAYSVTIEDNGSYDSIAQQNKVLNKTISSVIKMVESNGDTVINNFGIILDSNNNYQFVAQMRLRNYVLLPMYMENQPSTSFLKTESNNGR